MKLTFLSWMHCTSESVPGGERGAGHSVCFALWLSRKGAAFLLFFLRSLSFQSLFKLVYEGKGEQAKRQEDDDVDAEGTSRNVFCKEVWLQVDEEVQHDRQDHAVG